MEPISVTLGPDWPKGLVLYQTSRDVKEFRRAVEHNFTALPPAAHQAFENMYTQSKGVGVTAVLKNGDWAIVVYKCDDPPLGILMHELVHFGFHMAKHRNIPDDGREEFIASISQAVFNRLLPDFRVL